MKNLEIERIEKINKNLQKAAEAFYESSISLEKAIKIVELFAEVSLKETGGIL